MIGESETTASEIAATPPWRIGSATADEDPRPKLNGSRLPAWLCRSTAMPSVACAMAGTGRQKSGLAAISVRRDRRFTGTASCS